MTQTVLMTLLGVTLAVGELAIGIAVGWWLRSRQMGLGIGVAVNGEGIDRLRTLALDLTDSQSFSANEIGTVKEQLDAIDRRALSAGEEAVVDALARMAEANQQLQTELDKSRHQVESQALVAGTDATTGLTNRKGFDVDLSRRLAQWEQDEAPLSLVVIDVDNLAEIEEKHGPQASDAVIRGLADVLCQVTREMDLVARYDDHEFAVMLPDTDLAEAQETAARVRSAVADETFLTEDDVELDITISEGVVELIKGDDTKSLIQRAERALDSAREAGRDQAHSHDGTVCRPITTDAQSEDQATGFVDVDLNSQSNQQTANATDPRIDPLTGQLSRRALFDLMREQVVEHAGAQIPLSLALIEIDALERIVSKHGQAIADVVVRTLTQIVCTATRARDHVARYDQGTLALVSSGIALGDATLLVERIRRAVSACKLRAGGSDLKVSVSAGVAESATGEDSLALMSHADAALKSARIAGCDCTHCWNSESQSTSSKHLLVS